jgi:ankyrin repeat protein
MTRLLHRSIYHHRKDTEIVKYSVEHCADVYSCDDKNVTPLDLASFNGHTEIVKHLVEHGADVNICTDSNVTPLYRASQKDQTFIRKWC